MKKKICKPCYAICALFFALPFMVPGVSAASIDAIHNVMTGDQTNWPMKMCIRDRFTSADVQNALQKEQLSALDFAALLSPAAQPLLEQMAQKAKRLTCAQFGNNVGLYTPVSYTHLIIVAMIWNDKIIYKEY